MAIHIRRREFIGALGGAAAVWSIAAQAQQSMIPVIGFVNSASPGGSYPSVPAFLEGLGKTGFVEGRDVAIEYRWAEGHYERLPALIAELVQRKVSVIAATSTPAALAAKPATSTIPIVFEIGSDPVELGLVASLSRPEGNVTGVTNLTVELTSKQLGLLHELVPGVSVIAVLVNPNFGGAEKQLRDVEAAARVLGLQVIPVRAGAEGELETAFETLTRQGAGALLVSIDPFFAARFDRIVGLAARYAIPAIHLQRDFALAGGLMSYGTDFTEAYHQAGVYTGKILNGAKPADLPVFQSIKFQLVINLKTAKVLGLTIPASLLAIADEVIE